MDDAGVGADVAASACAVIGTAVPSRGSRRRAGTDHVKPLVAWAGIAARSPQTGTHGDPPTRGGCARVDRRRHLGRRSLPTSGDHVRPDRRSRRHPHRHPQRRLNARTPAQYPPAEPGADFPRAEGVGVEVEADGPRTASYTPTRRCIPTSPSRRSTERRAAQGRRLVSITAAMIRALSRATSSTGWPRSTTSDWVV